MFTCTREDKIRYQSATKKTLFVQNTKTIMFTYIIYANDFKEHDCHHKPSHEPSFELSEENSPIFKNDLVAGKKRKATKRMDNHIHMHKRLMNKVKHISIYCTTDLIDQLK